MKYFSMFSGVGGFELGIKRAYCNKQSAEIEQDRERRNWNSDEERGDVCITDKPPLCVGFSEIDKYAIATYESHFKDHKNFGDATKINPRDLPDFDMLCGGFPCQSFSIAGKRRGFEDTRGTLFFDIARIIEIKRPKIIFLENVKGLLNHDEGKTFSVIIQTLSELGYDVQWMVLNSKFFGVPQNRERVFIIGSLRGTTRPEVLPFRETTTKNIGEYEMKQLFDLRNMKNMKCHVRLYSEDGIAKSLQSEGGGWGANTGIYMIDLYNKKVHSDRSPTLTEPHHNTIRVKESSHKIRRLTPVECERLQGFPDNWTIGSDTQRYKQCGNAVTVNVIQAIMERLL